MKILNQATIGLKPHRREEMSIAKAAMEKLRRVREEIAQHQLKLREHSAVAQVLHELAYPVSGQHQESVELVPEIK